MADEIKEQVVENAKQTGKALSALLAVLTFLEKITVPALMWLWQVAKNKQIEAEAKVAYYETKEKADNAKIKIDDANKGKSSRRIISDFLGRKSSDK